MKDIFKTARALRIYGICAMAISFACIIFRLLATLFFFDVDIGYYQSGSIVAMIASYLPTIAAVVSLILCAVSKISVIPAEPRNTKAVRICALFPAIGFIGYTVIYAISMVEYHGLYGELPLVYILMLVASVISAVFFALLAFKRNVGNAYFAVSGIFLIIWLIIALAESYFDSFVQMNSPIKMIFQFATLSAVLLTVNELRVDLEVKKPRFHLFAATVATVFLGTSSIPSIICSFTGHMPSSYILFYSDCILLLLFVFSTARLCQLCFAKHTATDSVSVEEVVESEATQYAVEDNGDQPVSTETQDI